MSVTRPASANENVTVSISLAEWALPISPPLARGGEIGKVEGCVCVCVWGGGGGGGIDIDF